MAMSTARHVSPSLGDRAGAEFGQDPCAGGAPRPSRIWSSVKGGGYWRVRTPRPPRATGPATPRPSARAAGLRRARSTAGQVSPGAEAIGPERELGQDPVRWRWASAHFQDGPRSRAAGPTRGEGCPVGEDLPERQPRGQAAAAHHQGGAYDPTRSRPGPPRPGRRSASASGRCGGGGPALGADLRRGERAELLGVAHAPFPGQQPRPARAARRAAPAQLQGVFAPDQVSPGALAMTPDLLVGQARVRPVVGVRPGQDLLDRQPG